MGWLQGGVAQFADSHFQALTQGAFQPVYQAAQSSYDRISPVNVAEYPTSANNADALQQYRTLSTDGASIIRVSTIADSNGNPQSLVTVSLVAFETKILLYSHNWIVIHRTMNICCGQ